jgi:N-methylhydantoinase B
VQGDDLRSCNKPGCPPWGLAGGGAGKPAGGEVIRASGERYPLRKGILAVGKDDVLVILSGGGGHGPASERGADRLNADVLEGYVTVEGALSDYGMELKSGADEGQET